MTKTRRGPSNVYKRGGKWAAVIDLGQQDAQRCPECRTVHWVAEEPRSDCRSCGATLGKPRPVRRQKWLSGFKTEKAAKQALTLALGQVDDGTYVEPSKQTLGDYLREWLERKRVSVRPATWDSYRRNIEHHVIPHLGSIPLRRLTSTRLDAFYADLLAGGRRDRGGGLSPRTVRYAHTLIRMALADAVSEKPPRIRWNAADAAKAPKVKTPEMKTWTAVQAGRFLEAVRSHPLFPAWLLAAMTAMRRGEIAGLRWSDIDFEAGRAHIRQTVIIVGNKVVIGEPKSDKSKRSIPIDPKTLTVLRDHRLRQNEERLAHSGPYEDHDLVFAQPNGRPIDPSRLTKTLPRLAREAGVPVIRFHDLRHTWITLARASGVDLGTISEIAGHSSVSFTMDRYGHPVPALQDAATAKVADLMRGGA